MYSQISFCRSDQEFRDILKDYAPWTDEAIAIIYGEKETPISQAIATTRSLATSASETIFGTSPAPPPPPSPSKRVEPVKSIPKTADVPAPLNSELFVKYCFEFSKSIVFCIELLFSVPVPKPPEPVIVEKVDVIPKIEKFDSPEAAAAMEAACKTTISAYKRATEALKVYSKKIDKVSDSFM